MTVVWDDAAFKTRVRVAAEKKGMRVRDALLAAGVSEGYLDKSGTGRSTAVVLRLAEVLDVNPIELFGLDNQYVNPFFADGSETQHEKLVRISVYTKIIAAQLATLSTLAYSASTGSELEAKTLAELMRAVMDQLIQVDRGGKGG